MGKPSEWINAATQGDIATSTIDAVRTVVTLNIHAAQTIGIAVSIQGHVKCCAN